MRRSSAVLLFLLLLLSIRTARGETHWFSPLGLTKENAAVTIAPGIPSTSVRITASAPGTYFVNLGLHLPDGATIDAVGVCYELASVANFITQTRLTSMRLPNSASVFMDDATDHNLLTLECYEVLSGGTVTGAITLALRLEFANTTDWIEIGGISVRITPALGVVDPAGEPEVPASVRLEQNHPNPFNPTTSIEYRIEREDQVELKIFTPSGQLVRTLVEGHASPGSYAIQWDGRDDAGRSSASGVYCYRLTVGGSEESKRMILLK